MARSERARTFGTGPRPGIALLFPILIFLATSWQPAGATVLRRLNLEQMHRKAGTIVAGRCVDVKVVEHPNLGISMTKVTLEVDRAFKGTPGRRFTFRMAGSGEPEAPFAVGLPRFQVGEEILLFLYAESRHGFTSPVGFGQGKFIKSLDKSGREGFSNQFGNRDLFKGLSGKAEQALGNVMRRRGPGKKLKPADLIEAIESLGP